MHNPKTENAIKQFLQTSLFPFSQYSPPGFLRQIKVKTHLKPGDKITYIQSTKLVRTSFIARRSRNQRIPFFTHWVHSQFFVNTIHPVAQGFSPDGLQHCTARQETALRGRKPHTRWLCRYQTQQTSNLKVWATKQHFTKNWECTQCQLMTLGLSVAQWIRSKIPLGMKYR